MQKCIEKEWKAWFLLNGVMWVSSCRPTVRKAMPAIAWIESTPIHWYMGNMMTWSFFDPINQGDSSRWLHRPSKIIFNQRPVSYFVTCWFPSAIHPTPLPADGRGDTHHSFVHGSLFQVDSMVDFWISAGTLPQKGLFGRIKKQVFKGVGWTIKTSLPEKGQASGERLWERGRLRCFLSRLLLRVLLWLLLL